MIEENRDDRNHQSIRNILTRYRPIKIDNNCRNNPVIYETGRFCLPNQKSLDTQYSKVYHNRYMAQKNSFDSIIKKHKLNLIDKIQKLQQQKESIVVIGTLYKQMKLKPNIMLKIAGQVQQKFDSYISGDDQLFLEDLSGRIKLEVNKCQLYGSLVIEKTVTTEDLITGLVVMIEGRIISTNLLQVQKIFLPELVQQEKIVRLQMDLQTHQDKANYIAFISGINYQSDTSSPQLCAMLQFFQGKISCGLTKQISEKISSIVIAGDLVYQPPDVIDHLTGALKKQDTFKSMFLRTEQNWKELDTFLEHLTSVTPVYIMPGESDPTSCWLPQQPLYKAYFPKTFSSRTNLHLLSNPTELVVGERKLLGTSGQNVKDIKKYCNYSQSDLQILEATLEWNNMAPTAPDTIQCYPNLDTDPFVIKELPDLYFAGNLDTFDTKLIDNDKATIRIFTIPKFSETQEICLVEINSLNCFSIKMN